MGKIGYIHSIESIGAVDGPGLRTVVFMQGCPLRCVYCHNPDSWAFKEGNQMDSDMLAEKIERYKPFFRRSGGVTVSGGEPMAQPYFVEDLFKQLGERGIHRALDTSGATNEKAIRAVLGHTDLVLLDCKSTIASKYRDITGADQTRFVRMLEQTALRGITVWLRFVVVPGLTDQKEEQEALMQYKSRYANIQRIEVLGFHKLGEQKWKELNLPYTLDDTPAADPATILEWTKKCNEQTQDAM